MSKHLFHKERSRWLPKIIGICFLVCIIIRYILAPYNHLKPIAQASFNNSLRSIGLKIPSLKSSIERKTKISVLTTENKVLHMLLENSPQPILWKSKNLQTLHLKNVIWNNNEHWFVTGSCDNCTILNASGLIGHTDPVFGAGVIKLITHRDTLIVVKDPTSGRVYLLQGQGYNRDMLVLESDSSDYPPLAGSIVYTSGLDALYPPYIPVGTVVKKGSNYSVQTFFNRKLGPDIYALKNH